MPLQSSRPTQLQCGSFKDVENELILKHFERKTSKQQEDEMDADVLGLIEGLPSDTKDPKDYAIALGAISTSQGSPPINKSVTNIFKNAKLLEENPPLLELLVECVRKGKFADIRDLEILRTYRDLDPTEFVKQSHEELFFRLQVTVDDHELRKWSGEEIIQNGGVMHADDAAGDDSAFSIIQDILSTLRKPKIYSEEDERRDQASSFPQLNPVRKHYPDLFGAVFKPAEGGASSNLIDGSEFEALYNVIGFFPLALSRVPTVLASSPITYFCKHFTHPAVVFPHRNSQMLIYREDKTCSIPMLVHLKDDPTWYTLSPRNIWTIVATRSDLPLIMCEVPSKYDPLNEPRMLLKAMVACRVGSYLIKSASSVGVVDKSKEERSTKRRKSETPKQNPFFVVALYLGANFVVRRYLVISEDETTNTKVHLFEKEYDLKETRQACLFLLELFNLSSLLEDLANSLDVNKEDELRRFKDAVATWEPLPSIEDDIRTRKRNFSTMIEFP